jgi:hypothetical protein
MLPMAAVFAVAASAHPVTLAVSPARTVFRAPASRTLQVSNLGSADVAVDVAWKALDRPGATNGWLRIAPGHLVLRRGTRAFLTVRAGHGANPGDHDVLVLVTGSPTDRGRVAVRLRIGVRVRIRAPGRLVRRVAVEGLRVRRSKHRRALLVSVANRGNVTEQLSGRLTVTLVRHARVISRLRLGRLRELYPGTRAIAALPYAGRARGLVTAVVAVRLGAKRRPLVRRYRLLL